MKVIFKFKNNKTEKVIELPIIISNDINEYQAIELAFANLIEKLNIDKATANNNYEVIEVPQIYQTKTNEDARSYVLKEWAYYATHNYISFLFFKDAHLRRLWKEADGLISILESYSNDVNIRENLEKQVEDKLAELEKYLNITEEDKQKYNNFY